MRTPAVTVCCYIQTLQLIRFGCA